MGMNEPARRSAACVSSKVLVAVLQALSHPFQTGLVFELVQERGAVDNFASFLRVCCGRYLALQLSGGIPQDASIPISSLNAQRVLATEHSPFPMERAPFELVSPSERQSRVA